MARNNSPNNAFIDVYKVIRKGSISRINKKSLKYKEDKKDYKYIILEIYDLDSKNPEGLKDAFKNLFSNILDTIKGSLTKGIQKAY